MDFDYAKALRNSNRNPRLSFGGIGVSTNEEGPEVSIERAFKIEKFTRKARKNRKLREAMIVTTPVAEETEVITTLADVANLGILVESGDDIAEVLMIIQDEEGGVWARTRTSEGNVVDIADHLWEREFGAVIADILLDRTMIASLRTEFGLPALV